MWPFDRKKEPRGFDVARADLEPPVMSEVPAAPGAAPAGDGGFIPFNALNDVNPALIVQHLVDDPCSPPDVRVLAGYPGYSSRGFGWFRLYLTLELDDWVDIFHRDILFAEDAGDQRLSGRVLWVRKDAEVWHQSVASRQVLAQDLIQGNLARRYLPRGVPNVAPPIEQGSPPRRVTPRGMYSTSAPLDSYEAFDPVSDPPSVGRYC
jgi:hypothetical protein